MPIPPAAAPQADAGHSLLSQLNERARDVLRQIVEGYVASGSPIGSGTLARQGAALGASPATIRNVMQDLEEMGLLHAPHTSAGRLPTESGLRMYVDGLLEMGSLSSDQRQEIEARAGAAGRTYESLLAEAGTVLSSLSSCAGIVVAPKTEGSLKHIEFVPLRTGRALVVLVFDSGLVENRIIEVPPGLPQSSLIEAGNYLAAQLRGRGLNDLRTEVSRQMATQKTQLDVLTQKVVSAGIAEQAGDSSEGVLIVRGQSNLLENVENLEDLERIRKLFAALEAKENAVRLLQSAESAGGCQVFIGAQNELFGLSGMSMILRSYRNADQQVIGAVGVIGPMRMNYGHLVPMVDYTSRVIGELLS